VAEAKKVYRGKTGGQVVGSDVAADWLALDKLHREWQGKFVELGKLTAGEEMTSMSVNHPYFSVKEMEQRDRALQILGQVVEVLTMLATRMNKTVMGRPKVHADTAAKQKAYRLRKRNGDLSASEPAQ
jgi:hypothetical protein